MSKSPHAPTSSALAVRLHLQREGAPVELLRFDTPEITIGRASAGGGSAPAVAIADRSVSRRHAAILVGAKSLVLEDRGGQAGIFVGGRRVRRQVLAPGESFAFAGYTAWVERVGRRPGGGERRLLPSEAANSGPVSPGGPPEGQAMDWVRDGEPDGLLLRGRELRGALEWLRARPATPLRDSRRRWIERSDDISRRRRRGRWRWSLALGATLGIGTVLGVRELPAAAEHAPMSACQRAELAELDEWLAEDPASLRRNALALAWARAMGCRSARIEGNAHRALARTPSMRVAELPRAGALGMTSAGAGAALLTGRGAALHLPRGGTPTALGRPGSEWRTSGDGRWAAEIDADRRRIQVWALEGGPRPAAELRIEGEIAAVALDWRGRELWIASGGRIHRWSREGERWTAGVGREDGLSITSSDRVEVGLGGVIVDRGGALWWIPAASGRAQRIKADVGLWTVIDEGENLVTAAGGVVRRWRVHRRRLRGQVIAEFEEPVVQLAALGGSAGGVDLALATTAELRLVDTRQRWRPRQALSHSLAYSGSARGILSLESDPEGRWLAVVEASGASVWDLKRDTVRAPPVADFTWGSGSPAGIALLGDALLTISDGRVERWPLVGVAGGLDGVAVELGEASRTLALDPEGRWIAAGGDSRARVWAQSDATGWSAATDLELDEPASAMVFGSDGAWALAHGDTLDVHRLGASGVVVTSESRVMAAPIEHLVVADNGRSLLAADAGGDLLGWSLAGSKGSNGDLRTWSLGASATAVAVDPEGTLALVGDHRGGVQSFRVDRPAGVRALPEHEGAVLAVAVSAGGEWLVSSGEDRRLHIMTGEGEVRSSSVRPAAVDSLAFVGDGAWLAARERLGTISLHATGSSRSLLLGVRPGPPEGLLAGGRERLYVLGEEGAVELWELRLTAGRPRVASVTEIAGGGGAGVREWRLGAGLLLSADREGSLRTRPLGVDALVELLCRLQPTGEALGGPMPAEFAASLCDRG